MHALEDFCKRRNDEQVDDDHCRGDRDDDEYRIAHRRFDAIARVFFELEVFRQLQQHFLHGAGRFSDLDHTYVEIRKDLRVALERGGELQSRVERLDARRLLHPDGHQSGWIGLARRNTAGADGDPDVGFRS